MKRPKGTGWYSKGYLIIQQDGISKFEHVRIVEKALGRELPKGAEVHHVDENKSNNSPGNLVVCPSHAYHALLHRRQRALDACGNANWRLCSYCKKHDDPVNMAQQGIQLIHRACKQAYDKRRWACI